LPPGKDLQNPLNRRLEVPWNWYEHVGEEKKSLVPARNKMPDHLACTLDTITIQDTVHTAVL
jgi:hypothetical protein